MKKNWSRRPGTKLGAAQVVRLEREFLIIHVLQTADAKMEGIYPWSQGIYKPIIESMLNFYLPQQPRFSMALANVIPILAGEK